MVLIENVMEWPLVPKKEWKLIYFSESVLGKENVRGNSSMKIKHIPGVTYLNMQGNCFFFFFFQFFLVL